MVEIRVVIEGGIIPHSNDRKLTVDGSEKLRESFHKLFVRMIKPNFTFNIIIEMGGGIEAASKSFDLYSKIDSKTVLLVDLDGNKKFKSQKIADLGINNLYSQNVFFMVQEFEAWILSQPDAIKRAYDERYIKRNPKINMEGAIKALHNNNFEEIVKPSVKLKEILGKYYLEIKGNKQTKKKYGKLKDAPFLIENLDINKLIDTFEDLKFLKIHIEK